jgi:hypothetical protein
MIRRVTLRGYTIRIFMYRDLGPRELTMDLIKIQRK